MHVRHLGERVVAKAELFVELVHAKELLALKLDPHE